MSINTTGKKCDVEGCGRLARSNASPYCDTHYQRVHRGEPDPLRPLIIGTCPECGHPARSLIGKFCSDLCRDRHARATPPEKQRGRKPPVAMVEADLRIWAQLLEFPDYEISNDGRLRRRTHGSNSKPGRLIRPTIGQTGYPQYGLTSPDGKRCYITAHRLVALAFLPPPKEGKPLVLHNNDNKLDARDCNLRWGSALDNANDAIRNMRISRGIKRSWSMNPWSWPRGENHFRAKLTEDQVRLILLSPESADTLAERYDVDPSTISAIRRRKNWRHVTDGVFAAELNERALQCEAAPAKRKGFSTRQRFELIKSQNYRCHLCKGLIYPGQAWDISHEIPLGLGGLDDEINRRAAHRKCHRKHTAKVDIPAIAKAKRVQAAHHGAKISRRPMPGGRNDRFKKRMDGTVVFRETGYPAFERKR